MKKFYYLSMAALALMATACSSDETVEMSPSSKQAIGFNAFVDKSVRADITTGNITEFAVYGFAGDSNTKIFDGENVSKGESNVQIDGTTYQTLWSYSSPRYWKNMNYWFTAIAPYGGNYELAFPTASSSDPASYTGGGTITFDNEKAAGKQDLIYAFQGPEAGSSHTSGTNDPVAFTFNHLLSKVRFTFLNNVATGYTLQVTDLQITGMPKKRTIEPSNVDGVTYDWKQIGTGTEETFSLAYDNQNVAYREGDGTPDNQQYYETVTNGDGTTTYKEIEDVCYLIPVSTTTDGVTTTTLTATFSLLAKYSSEGSTATGMDYPSTGTAKSFTATITINEGLKKGYSYNIIAAITAPVLESNLVPILFTVEKVNEYVPADDITLNQDKTDSNKWTNAGSGTTEP